VGEAAGDPGESRPDIMTGLNDELQAGMLDE